MNLNQPNLILIRIRSERPFLNARPFLVLPRKTARFLHVPDLRERCMFISARAKYVLETLTTNTRLWTAGGPPAAYHAEETPALFRSIANWRRLRSMHACASVSGVKARVVRFISK